MPAEVALAFHPRTFAQVLFLRDALDQGVARRSVPRRGDRRDPPRQDAVVPLDPHAEHVQHGAALRPRLRGPHGVQSPERDAFDRLDAKLTRLFRDPLPADAGIALLGDARDAGSRASAALRARGLPDRVRLVLTSPPYLRVVKYGYYNWLRAWFLGFDSKAIDASLDDAHHRAPYLEFLREVLRDLRPALTDDGIAVLVIGDVATDRGRRPAGRARPRRAGLGGGRRARRATASPGIADDDVHAHRKMTKLWGREAGRATQVDRILVLAATEAGRRRAGRAPACPSTGPGRRGVRAI